MKENNNNAHTQAHMYVHMYVPQHAVDVKNIYVLQITTRKSVNYYWPDGMDNDDDGRMDVGGAALSWTPVIANIFLHLLMRTSLFLVLRYRLRCVFFSVLPVFDGTFSDVLDGTSPSHIHIVWLA